MNLVNRAAVVERFLNELGNPDVIAVTLWPHDVTVQLDQPIAGFDWEHRAVDEADHWRTDVTREDIVIRLCACLIRAGREEA